jgi:hypothetical protein
VHDHCSRIFRQLVVARPDSAAIFQPTEHALNEIALSVFGLVKPALAGWALWLACPPEKLKYRGI